MFSSQKAQESQSEILGYTFLPLRTIDGLFAEKVQLPIASTLPPVWRKQEILPVTKYYIFSNMFSGLIIKSYCLL